MINSQTFLKFFDSLTVLNELRPFLVSKFLQYFDYFDHNLCEAFLRPQNWIRRSKRELMGCKFYMTVIHDVVIDKFKLTYLSVADTIKYIGNIPFCCYLSLLCPALDISTSECRHQELELEIHSMHQRLSSKARTYSSDKRKGPHLTETEELLQFSQKPVTLYRSLFCSMRIHSEDRTPRFSRHVFPQT